MKQTILIIEDNDSNRLLLKDLLTYHGYSVLEARNGLDGMKRAKEIIPDLILMDIQMPLMDGLTAVRRLKDDPLTHPIKIIALTSFAMDGDRQMFLAAGFDGYIAKPIDTREFPLIIKKELAGENDA